MPLRLHRGGILRRWIGARLGGDFELGDRVLRRGLHAFAAIALVYYLLPTPLLPGVSNALLLLVVLGAVLGIEAGRHLIGIEVPTLRDVESRRVASYAYFAVAIVAALLLFPRPIASVVIVGTAFVDPLLGELRLGGQGGRWMPLGPWALYGGLAVLILRVLTGWPLPEVILLGLAAATGAIAAEMAKNQYLDDDLLMTLVPALVLYVLAAAWPA
ncbi:MAG: hypothetical protein ACYDFT_00480 [Thermoplasmata archaeon]